MALGVVSDLMPCIFEGFDLIPSHKAISVCIQKPFFAKPFEFRLIGFAYDVWNHKEAAFDAVLRHDSGRDEIVFEAVVEADRGRGSVDFS